MKIVAKIVARVAENLVKYMQLGDGTLGEVRGVRTIFENNRETIFIWKIIARQFSFLKIIVDTISI